MQVTANVYSVHIADTAVSHPGGSNIFFVGDPVYGMALIDTGEHDMQWTSQILDAYKSLGRPVIDSILITHSHSDHIGGLDKIFEITGSDVRCHPKLVERLSSVVGDDHVSALEPDENVVIGRNIVLKAIFTPGHDESHVCFYLPSDRVMLTGDTVLGSSSTTVQNLKDYMESLDRLANFGIDVICPGHGPVVMPPEGSKLIPKYIDHRNQREKQVLDAMDNGFSDLDDIVKYVYPDDLPEGLYRGATRNVLAHLRKLLDDGIVSVESSQEIYRRVT